MNDNEYCPGFLTGPLLKEYLCSSFSDKCPRCLLIVLHAHLPFVSIRQIYGMADSLVY